MRKYLLIIVFLGVFFLGCQEHKELTTPEESLYRFNTSSEYSLHYSEFSDMIDILEIDDNGYIIFLYEEDPCQIQISVDHDRVQNPFLKGDEGDLHDREYIPVDPKFFAFLERMQTFIDLGWVGFDTAGHLKAVSHKINAVTHLINKKQFFSAMKRIEELYIHTTWIQDPEFETIFKMYLEATYWMVENPDGNLYLPQTILVCACHTHKQVAMNELCKGWGVEANMKEGIDWHDACQIKCAEIYGDQVTCTQGSADTSSTVDCAHVCNTME
ncbi:hypothetical protein KAU32_08650 [bacterium]|nr:hypothetical protein [bacterium]